MVREYAEFSLRVVRLAGIPERIKLFQMNGGQLHLEGLNLLPLYVKGSAINSD